MPENRISKSSVVVGFGSRYFFIASLIIMACILRFLCFPFRCVHIRSKTIYYQVNSEHNPHKDRRNKLCISLLCMAVDRLNDLLLLGAVHTDRLERLPGATVRADERFEIGRAHV